MQDPILTPLLVTAGVSGGFAIGATTISYAAVLSHALIAGALVGASLALAGNQPPVQKPADGTQPLRQRTPARIAAYGTETRVPGRYMLYALTDGGFSVDVLAFCEGPINGIVKYYLHDDPVVLDIDGVVQGLADGAYGDNKVQILTRLGALLETAYAEVIELVPDMGGVEWTVDHRGDGIASAAIICRSVGASGFQKRYPHGLPQLSLVVNGLSVPALAGISNDPETWQPSDNPILQAVRYITDPHVGMGAPYDLLIAPGIAELEARAAACEVLIEKKDATLEPRYRHRSWFQLDSDPIAFLAGMMESCDGWIAQGRYGALAIIPGVYEPPDDDATLSDDDIIGASLDYGVADTGRIDELEITFQSPVHDYKIIDGEPWVALDNVPARGTPRRQPLALAGVPSFSQARRLAKLYEQRANASLRGSLTTTWNGIRCAGKRWVHLSYSGVDELNDCIIEIRRMRQDFIGNVIELEFVVIDPETFFAWNAELEEGTAPRTPVKPGRQSQPIPQGVTATAIGDEIAGFHLQIEFPAPTREGLHYVVQFRVVNGTPGPWAEETFDTVNYDTMDPIVLVTGEVIADAHFEVQVASLLTVSGGITRSEWSASAFATTFTLDARLTEAGDVRITEAGDRRVLEEA